MIDLWIDFVYFKNKLGEEIYSFINMIIKWLNNEIELPQSRLDTLQSYYD